ncbi:MAG: translation initiation factor IF-2, partial [Nitrospinota bacterium]
MKVRIYELAKKLGMENKALVAALKEQGLPVKTHSSTLDEETAELVIKKFSKPKKAPPVKRVRAKKKAPVAKKRARKAPAEVRAEGAPPAAVAPPPEEKAPPEEERPPEPKVVKPPPAEEKPEEKPPPPRARVIPGIKDGVIIPLEELRARGIIRRPPRVKPPRRKEEPREERRAAAPPPPPPPLPEPPAPPEVRRIRLAENITVKELAEKLKAKSAAVIKKLMEMGVMVNINQLLDPKLAAEVSEKFGCEAEVVVEDVEAVLQDVEDPPESLKPRAPVVTIMGHVDHGKTKLLDAIRRTKVMEAEAGGITQHIGAYRVSLPKGELVFLDTPGHEAFTAMRARGAQVTDLVVLVVAADDGVMPQTREAIAHARAAGVPIMVAINKIDLPDADPDRVKRQLMEFNLVPEEWGGGTVFTEVSAKEGIGIDDLLELILVQAEIMELKANPERPAKGVVIEAKLDKARGAVATVLVQKGTLEVGQTFVCGLWSGKVRALIDDRGRKRTSCGPSWPVEVLGFTGVPQAGDTFIVLEDERKARQISNFRLQKHRQEELTKTARVSLDDFFSKVKDGTRKELNLIIKADVQGSVEAVKDALEKLGNEDVRVNVIHASPGGITETDIMLALASDAIVIGFNVRPAPSASEVAQREGVDIRLYPVIYDAISEVKAALEGILEPTTREVIL